MVRTVSSVAPVLEGGAGFFLFVLHVYSSCVLSFADKPSDGLLILKISAYQSGDGVRLGLSYLIATYAAFRSFPHTFGRISGIAYRPNRRWAEVPSPYCPDAPFHKMSGLLLSLNRPASTKSGVMDAPYSLYQSIPE